MDDLNTQQLRILELLNAKYPDDLLRGDLSEEWKRLDSIESDIRDLQDKGLIIITTMDSTVWSAYDQTVQVEKKELALRLSLTGEGIYYIRKLRAAANEQGEQI